MWALVIFAGPPGRHDGLPNFLEKLGWRVIMIDIKIGGAAHDVTRPGVAAALLEAIRLGTYDVVFLATPCESFSVAHRPALRTKREPWGVEPMPHRWQLYMRKHNAIARFTIEAIRTAIVARVVVAVENPADRGNPDSPAYWRRFADHGSFWALPEVREMGLHMLTFAQCRFGARVQKWTEVGINREASGACAELEGKTCTHQGGRHEQLAHGRYASGVSKAPETAAYPPQLCSALAQVLTRAAHENRRRPRTIHEGGRIADGALLTRDVSAACERARHVPPRYASLRNRRPERREVLAVQRLPGDLRAPMTTARPLGGRVGKKGKQHPAPIEVLADDSAVPIGRIHVSQLYADGVYDGVIVPWFEHVQREVKKMLETGSAPKVETIVIGERSQPTFARGIIWDCSDPNDCKPAQRSDRNTIFPGARQIDRVALRAAALELDWHDTDIIDQAGEGGVESRSACSSDTVLSWHHAGLTSELQAARDVVEADQREEWVSPLTAHIMWVPIRLLPRNVIMQDRVRLDEHNRLVPYSKPRVSQDSSDGAEKSVNAGIHPSEVAITLPTVQTFAKGLAVCDTAGTTPVDEQAGETPVRATAYAVDATSAFRFCPLQRVCIHQQCFVWWEARTAEDGTFTVSVGVCEDRRMGFGGAFSPNRFERISIMAAALAQRAQERFDETQPPPACAERWAARRREVMREGRLPDDPQQLAPRHLQVFIDDYNGSALDDTVCVPPEVAAVVIDPKVAVAAGGVPAHTSSRAHVHAALVVMALRRLGLEAAENKTVTGMPIGSLGFRVDRVTGTIDVPPLKRAAIMADTTTAEASALQRPPTVDVKMAEKLVGRACNLAQVIPELGEAMHDGYTITCASTAAMARGARRPAPQLRLRAGSDAHVGWLYFLRTLRRVVRANEGVPLAPVAVFPSRTEGSAITSTTDASGTDGVGGYVFSAARPGHVWVVSEAWPPDIKRALEATRMTKRARSETGITTTLSTPAAELFGAWAVPQAAMHAGVEAGPVYAIGDCDAAVGALNAAGSSNRQMHLLVVAARRLAAEWLAVSVPREANGDADTLSHPERARIIVAAAKAAGLIVHEPKDVPISESAWRALRGAIAAATNR